MTAAPVDLDGLVYGMPDPEYRAVPRISQSGLKTILDCPARYVWETENRVEKKAFDFGHIVHAELLGTGLGGETLSPVEWLALGVIVFAVVLVTLGKYLLPAKPVITPCGVEKP